MAAFRMDQIFRQKIQNEITDPTQQQQKMPRPLRDDPVWVKTWVKNVALLWVSQTGSFYRRIRTSDTFKTTLDSLFRGVR